jgi:hypothetical protein
MRHVEDVLGNGWDLYTRGQNSIHNQYTMPGYMASIINTWVSIVSYINISQNHPV